ncbi:MAG: hypothetical protein ACKPB7_29035 [Sphaerospermopsis kisseleviana]
MKPHRIGYSKADNLFYVARRATDTEPEIIEATSEHADTLFKLFDLLED